MGLQVRKRTKGKNSWTNASYSSKGLHTSQTTRVGNGTLNLSSRGVRSTYNLGNGVRYVANTPWKKKEKKVTAPKVNENHANMEEFKNFLRRKIETLNQEEQNLTIDQPVVETKKEVIEVVKQAKKKLEAPSEVIQEEYTYKNPNTFSSVMKKIFKWYSWFCVVIVTLTILSSFFGN